MHEAVQAIEDCLANISIWMQNNLSQRNQNKTELIIFSAKQCLNKTRNIRLIDVTSCTKSTESIKNNFLEMEKRNNPFYKTCYHLIRRICSTFPYITTKASNTSPSSCYF